MMRELILGVLFTTAGAAAPLSAQQLHIGFDRHGVSVGGTVQIGGHRGPILRIGDRDCDEPVRYECRTVRVWVPGCRHIEHVPAQYGWVRDRCGRLEWTCIAPAYDRVVEEPGHWEWREERVPVSGRHRHRG